jgi:hypothetical protein
MGHSQIPTPAHTAGTGLKPAAYGLNAHLELQVLNGARGIDAGRPGASADRLTPEPASQTRYLPGSVDSANGMLILAVRFEV